MACTLSNKYAKNLSKRTVLLQLIIENVVTCFFGTQCTQSCTSAYCMALRGICRLSLIINRGHRWRNSSRYECDTSTTFDASSGLIEFLIGMSIARSFY